MKSTNRNGNFNTLKKKHNIAVGKYIDERFQTYYRNNSIGRTKERETFEDIQMKIQLKPGRFSLIQKEKPIQYQL